MVHCQTTRRGARQTRDACGVQRRCGGSRLSAAGVNFWRGPGDCAEKGIAVWLRSVLACIPRLMERARPTTSRTALPREASNFASRFVGSRTPSRWECFARPIRILRSAPLPQRATNNESRHSSIHEGGVHHDQRSGATWRVRRRVKRSLLPESGRGSSRGARDWAQRNVGTRPGRALNQPEDQPRPTANTPGHGARSGVPRGVGQW